MFRKKLFNWIRRSFTHLRLLLSHAMGKQPTTDGQWFWWTSLQDSCVLRNIIAWTCEQTWIVIWYESSFLKYRSTKSSSITGGNVWTFTSQHYDVMGFILDLMPTHRTFYQLGDRWSVLTINVGMNEFRFSFWHGLNQK